MPADLQTAKGRASSTGIDETEDQRAFPGDEEVFVGGKRVGRYLIFEHLGEGSMGVVWGAYDPELDRKVALKLVRVTGDDERARSRRARLRREAQAIAKLNHPNVVGVYDVGVEGTEQVFVAMEYVRGGTLEAWMASAPGPRPWSEVLARFIPAGRGLAAAHAVGIVHRDFKPANVLLGEDGRPRVADFGIARTVEDEESDSPLTTTTVPDWVLGGRTLTRTGAWLGTPAYMAPEQYLQAEVDARCDQFAFCVALFEALHGRRPFVGHDVETLMRAVARGEVTPPPRDSAVPQRINEALTRGLATDPRARWPDMDALLAALTEAPQERGRRPLFWGALVIAGLAAGLALSRERSPVAEGPCSEDDAIAALGSTWTPARRDALAERAAALDGAGATWTFTRLVPRLDGWSGAWRDGWIDACEATHARGEQSEALHDRRVACLERQRRRFSAYVALLEEGEGEQLRGALDNFDELDAPDECEDLERLMRGAAPPEDLESRAQVERLAAELDAIAAMSLAEDWEAVRRALVPVAAAVEAEGWPPLVAELRYLQGRSLAKDKALDAGEAAFLDALTGALAIGADDLAVRSALADAQLVAEWDARQDDALVLLRIAAAIAERAGDPALAAEVELTRAEVLERGGEFQASLDAATRAVALVGDDSYALGLARYRQCLALYHLGRYVESRDRYDDAQAAWGDRFAPSHRLRLGMLNAAGLLAGAAGDWETAKARFSELLARREAVFGPVHPEVSDALQNLGVAQQNLWDFAGARRSYERALAIREREFGPDNLYVGHGLANLSRVYVMLDEGSRAVDTAQRALEIITAVRGPAHYDTMLALYLLSDALLCAGELEAAAEAITTSLREAERSGSPSQRFAYALQLTRVNMARGRLREAERSLAEARALSEGEGVLNEDANMGLLGYAEARLAAAKGEHGLAFQLAEQARQLLAAHPDLSSPQLTEAERWLHAYLRQGRPAAAQPGSQ
ncbi:protein kinase [Pseudenhygromyxa sp. WMMC2535]|uniref:serine/threonine-protein kinase n=1 Tax=Pseudenhygromyxa sp. WMMC2535 TaxID=2712867 RepID=UPI001554EE3F|nr:serine/threonine-protein kinase [Pseudenhygromyxa sp. WMMC2535]NVB39065.1 protein kinase [Pseudenhygromyxa sp. WMMC2535]